MTTRIGTNGYVIHKTKYADTAWIVPGLIPAGLTMIAARPKAGKSWFTMQISKCVTSGEEMFGKKTITGKVLYLALEDNEKRLQKRMAMQGWTDKARRNIDFITVRPFLENIGPLYRDENYTKLYDEVSNGSYALVVIDTFNVAFMGLRNIDDNQLVTLALQPLQQIALERNIGVLVNDHHNKMSEQSPNLINDVLGSTAKVSISDTILGLYRKKKGTLRMMATGKDIEDIDIVVNRSDNFLYEIDSTPPGATESDDDLLGFLNGSSLRLAQLSELTNRAKSNVSVSLSRLQRMGLVEKTKDGFKKVN